MKPQISESDSHEGRLARLAHRLADQDPNPALPRGARLAMTIGPLAGFGFFPLLALLVAGYKAAGALAAVELGSFIGAGKFVIFIGVPEGVPVGVWVLGALVIYGDIATSLIMMANMTLLYRAPYIGVRLARAHEAGWHVLRIHPWMRRMAWLGVAAFVAAPFQGTGAVVGTIMARILGLSRLSTLSATFVGSAAGCAFLAALGSLGSTRLAHLARHPLAAAITFVVAIVVLLILGRWFMGHAAPMEELPAPKAHDEEQ